jgi:hypothetical protein
VLSLPTNVHVQNANNKIKLTINPRFGMVQAISNNHVSKLAPLMAKSTLEGKVNILNLYQ